MSTPTALAPEGAAPEVDLPRDRSGRVVRVGALVAIWGGGRATVDSIGTDGEIEVTRTDGKTITVDAGRVTVLRDVAPAEAPEDAEEPTVEDGSDTTSDDEESDREEDAESAIPGTQPAPDAEPTAEALSVLYSADRARMAWLEMEDTEPVGYYREDAEDPATTVRYDDSAQWAEEMDGLVDPAMDPAPPDRASEVNTIGDEAPEVDDEDVEPGQMPTQPGYQGTVAAPDTLDAFYADGLQPMGEGEGADIGTEQAHAEVVDALAERMAHLPESAYLSPERASILAQIEAGDIVYLRMPRRGYEGQYEYVEFDRGWFERQRAHRPMPEDAEVVTGDMLRALSLRERVNALIALWATTSNGEDPRALALQEVAAETFGIEGGEWDYAAAYGLAERVDEVRDVEGDLMAEFLTAQYDLTQQMLTDAGVTHIEVFRGYKAYDETPEWAAPAADGEEVRGEVPMRPLTSMTTMLATAGLFARGASTEEGYIIDGTVPIERLVATPRSGMGCLAEREVVVMAGPGTWLVRRATDLDAPAEDDGFQPAVEGWVHSDEDVEDWDEEPESPADLAPGVLVDAEELATAIAAAGPEQADDTRRAALVDRAAAMLRLDLVPDSWQGDGSIVEPPKGEAIGAMTDTEYAARIIAIETALSGAVDAEQMTDAQHTLDADRRVYSAERALAHRDLLDSLYSDAAHVPTDGRALVVGGLPGAEPMGVVDGATHLSSQDYMLIDVTAVMVAMAEADLLPMLPDLSPMDAALLAHEEAEHVALLLASRAIEEQRNIAWVLAMSEIESVEQRIAWLRRSGYGVIEGVFVNIDIETSVDRSRQAHRLATDRWRNGDGVGGRYVPGVAIRAHKDNDWPSSNRATFEAVKDGFAQWAVFDNAIPGQAPTRIDTSHGWAENMPERTAEEEQ